MKTIKLFVLAAFVLAMSCNVEDRLHSFAPIDPSLTLVDKYENLGELKEYLMDIPGIEEYNFKGDWTNAEYAEQATQLLINLTKDYDREKLYETLLGGRWEQFSQHRYCLEEGEPRLTHITGDFIENWALSTDGAMHCSDDIGALEIILLYDTTTMTHEEMWDIALSATFEWELNEAEEVITVTEYNQGVSGSIDYKILGLTDKILIVESLEWNYCPYSDTYDLMIVQRVKTRSEESFKFDLL